MTEQIRFNQIEHLAQNIIDNLADNQHIGSFYRKQITWNCEKIITLTKGSQV